MINSQQFYEKWQRRLAGATQDIQNGVNNVTVSPTAKAAAKQAKMLANLTASIQAGKWKDGLMKVTVDDWKNAMLNKGVGRIAAGTANASARVQAFANVLLPHIQQGQGKIASMPDMTLEDSIARMNAFTRHMVNMPTK